jgi:PAS domain-containing protein
MQQDGFLVTDAAGIILFANDVLCRLLRCTRCELITVDLDALLASRDGFQIEQSPIYGRAGEYLGCYAMVRLVH